MIVKSITRNKRISKERSLRGADSPETRPSNTSCIGVTTLICSTYSGFEGIEDSIAIIVVIEVVVDSVVVVVKLTCEIVAIVDFKPV